MKIETLKKLIENTARTSRNIEEFQAAVILLIDLYEADKLYQNPYPKWEPIVDSKQQVRYGDVCPCNPKNGGSGICGCVMANEIVSSENGAYSGNWTTSITIFNPDDKDKNS